MLLNLAKIMCFQAKKVGPDVSVFCHSVSHMIMSVSHCLSVTVSHFVCLSMTRILQYIRRLHRQFWPPGTAGTQQSGRPCCSGPAGG